MTTGSKLTAHGLDGTPVEPDWAPLTLEEARAILTQFSGGAEAVRILSVSPRPLSAASVIETSRGRFFMKRHHCSVRGAEGLMEEHRFMAHLSANNVPVPRVFEAVEGRTVVESGDWTYEVHAAAEGIDLYQDVVSWTPFLAAEHARSAGKTLARMHIAAKDYAAPSRRIQPLVSSFTIFAGNDVRAALEAYLAARPALDRDDATRRHCEEALELLAPFHAELAPLLPALTPIWTHNDLHGSNLFWSDKTGKAGVAAVIDFGLADRTNAIYDLAQAIERSVVEWLALMRDPSHPENVPVHRDHLYALLQGYEAVRPLSQDEASALVPMTALCHAEFALTEADYFLGVLRSKEKSHVATCDYLVGHARWFHSSAGRALLDTLRSWAEQKERPAVRA
jgi:Ser/Thr protein kinase RdoA (MazF antagonist)